MESMPHRLDVPAYLNRIGYKGPLTPSGETLRLLHLQHLYTVPFENLDIALGRPIVMDSDAFVHKIVEQNRGGFCYELNGAFARLLTEIGFRVTLLAARVAREDGVAGAEFAHLALRVDSEMPCIRQPGVRQPWLVDVGFGDCFLEPLLLEPGVEQTQANGRFRIAQAGSSLQLEKQQPDASWKTEYLFTLQPRELLDFAEMCGFHQTSPESYFTHQRICSMATPTGRITLRDRNLTVTRNRLRRTRTLRSETEWQATVRRHFGLNPEPLLTQPDATPAVLPR
jgi:N-hydroxyarylamine O-acetyltransferase